MTLRDEIRPLQSSRGRSVQGIKSRLDKALDRPQCLVFGLPPRRPMFSATEEATAWSSREYSWQFRGGNIAAPLIIKTQTAPPRHEFSSVSVALDLLPIYASGANGNPEAFAATAARGARGVLIYQIEVRQDGALLSKVSSEREVVWVPTNFKSSSHVLRTLGLQHYDLETFPGYGFGVNLTYDEGTFDLARDLETEETRIRESLALSEYDPQNPLEIEITAYPGAAGEWLDGNSAGLFGIDAPLDEYFSIWALGLSAWGVA